MSEGVSDYHEVLDVPQKVSEVDVEEVARGGDHNVVIVPVPYPLCVYEDHMTVT